MNARETFLSQQRCFIIQQLQIEPDCISIICLWSNKNDKPLIVDVGMCDNDCYEDYLCLHLNRAIVITKQVSRDSLAKLFQLKYISHDVASNVCRLFTFIVVVDFVVFVVEYLIYTPGIEQHRRKLKAFSQ